MGNLSRNASESCATSWGIHTTTIIVTIVITNIMIVAHHTLIHHIKHLINCYTSLPTSCALRNYILRLRLRLVTYPLCLNISTCALIHWSDGPLLLLRFVYRACNAGKYWMVFASNGRAEKPLFDMRSLIYFFVQSQRINSMNPGSRSYLIDLSSSRTHALSSFC